MRGGLHRQQVVGAGQHLAAGLARRGDHQVVQRDDARQVGHIRREGADVVVAAGHPQRDRQLGVVVLDDDLARPEQLELQAATEAARLMSDSSASISALPGSRRSSWVTYSCTCSFCLRSSSRLIACASLAWYSS